jgi:hypothetical protein
LILGQIIRGQRQCKVHRATPDLLDRVRWRERERP